MCHKGAKWKREVIPDHKFDFVDTRDFHSTTCSIRMRYLWLYIIVIKSFAVYVSDIFTAVTMLSTNNWTNAIFSTCPKKDPSKDTQDNNPCVFIPFSTGKWLFVGCIIFSFVLLAYEARKAKKIIASRDISYAFTNIMANNYYSLRSYDHFCFFAHINDSTKTLDNFAFFIFFTFKDWKRLLLADGPRQAINALTLYAVWLSKRNIGHWYSVEKYFSSTPELTITWLTGALLVSITFTVLIYAGSLLLLVVAAICYVPLLCHIRGNLKEYCCHKVDKRISELVKRKAKQRLQANAALARREAAGDFSHYKNSKGQIVGAPLPQPTLPQISLDDEPEPGYYKPDFKSDYQSSVYSGRGGGTSEYTAEYPPMPMYAGVQRNASFGHSAPTLHDGASGYEPHDRRSPQAQFDAHAQAYPFAAPYGAQGSQPAPYAQRPGYEQQAQPPYGQPVQYSSRPMSGLAYDDEPAEPAYAPRAQPQQRGYESRGYGGR